MSCSNPSSSDFLSDVLCPSPPKLSFSSAEEPEPRGSLESDSYYVREHLLRTFAGISGRPDFYFQSFQAGFTVNHREPSNSVCGCNRTQDIHKFIYSNSTMSCNGSSQV